MKESELKKQRIRFIKQNLHLSTDKLAKTLRMKKPALYKFCSRNNIKLSPEKNILKFIKDNPKMAIGLLAKKMGCNKDELYKIMKDNNIYDERLMDKNLTIIKKDTVKKKIVVPYKKKTKYKPSLSLKVNPESVNKLTYDVVTHQELNNIILKTDAVATKFINDLSLLTIGEALRIKKDCWVIKSNPYYYFKRITVNSSIKVRVKEIDDCYYAIRLK